MGELRNPSVVLTANTIRGAFMRAGGAVQGRRQLCARERLPLL